MANARPSMPGTAIEGIGLNGEPCKMALTTERLLSFIEQLEQRYETHHARIGWRRNHFHNRPAVDPVLPAPFDQGPKIQMDTPRRVHRALKSRLGENHFTIVVNPLHDTAPQRKPANRLENFLNDGIQLAEERLGHTLQDGMSDGQIIDCYAVLHWTKAADIWPDVPEPQMVDADDNGELPDGYDPDEYEELYATKDGGEASGPLAQYEQADDGQAAYEGDTPVLRQLKGYRQTTAARDKAYHKSCVEAGFPWLISFIEPQNYMEVRDISLLPQPGMAITRREVGLLEYIDAVNAEREKTAGSLHDIDEDVPVYGEEPAPVSSTSRGAYLDYPSEGGYKDTITIYEVWTRDEFYELADGRGFAKDVVKCGKHPYKMPPFAIVPAQVNVSSDPALKYEPALEGVFRLKPLVDLWFSHHLVLGQQTALPYYYWKNTGTGAPMLDEKGAPITFDQNTANAEVAPEGYELAKIDFEISQGFVQAGQGLAEMLKDAEPPTGQAEFTSSTQPWAIRLQQQQANVEPKMQIGYQAIGVRTMVRNMAMVHALAVEDGGFGETYVYARTEDGQVNQDEVESISPEDVLSLSVDVNITANSGAEQITIEQHGMELLQAKLITLEDFYENYMHRENPDEAVATLKATLLYEAQIEPQIASGVLAETFGTTFTMGPDGQMLNYAGQPVTPAQVLQANGKQPIQPPPRPSPAGTGATAAPTMPGMSTLATPGAIPIGGQGG